MAKALSISTALPYTDYRNFSGRCILQSTGKGPQMSYVEVKTPNLLKKGPLPEDFPHLNATQCLQEVLGHVDPQNTKGRTHFKGQEYLHNYSIAKQTVDRVQ